MYRAYSLDDARKILSEDYKTRPNGHAMEETGIPHLPKAYAADFLHPHEFGVTLIARAVIGNLQGLL